VSGFVPGRLVGLVGRDPWAIDEERLGRLMSVPESDELDFKREPSGNGESERRDLAADVAAFANGSGGLIIIGIEQSEGDGPATLTPLPMVQLDPEELRVHQIVAGSCRPTVELQVIPVRVSGGGVLVISVPPSPRRPHAVLVNESLRYPLRHGSTKRYLSESELANLYRNRFRDAAAQVATLQDRHQALANRLPLTDRAWLTVALQPTRTGAVEYSRQVASELGEFVTQRACSFPSWHGHTDFYVRGGYRSYRFRDMHDDVHSRFGDLYLDGAGSIAHGWDYRGDGPVDDGRSGSAMKTLSERSSTRLNCSPGGRSIVRMWTAMRPWWRNSTFPQGARSCGSIAPHFVRASMDPCPSVRSRPWSTPRLICVVW